MKSFLGVSPDNSRLVGRADTFHQALDDFVIPSSISTYNIVGCGNTDTIGRIVMFDHGKYNIFYTLGDKTVPIGSAASINGEDQRYYSIVKHLDLVKDDGVLEQILNILNEVPDTLAAGISVNASSCAFDRRTQFSSHSPVRLHVYDSQNNHLGPNSLGDIEYGIPDSSYDIIGDNNFVTVPDLATSTYRVFLEAYATGTFDFDISNLTGGSVTKKISYLNQPLLTASSTVTLIYSAGATGPTLDIDNDGNGTIDQIVAPTAIVTGSDATDITPPTIDVQSPDQLEYGRHEIININAAITDAESGLALLEIRFDDALIATSTASTSIDLFFKPLGVRTLNFLAFDKAGNPRELQQQFTNYADATSTIANIERAFSLGWIKKKDTKNSLIKDLKTIIKLEKKIIKLEGKLPPAVLKKLTPEQKIQKKIEKLEAKIDKILGKNFLKELEKKYKKGGITIEAYHLLREDVEWMMR